MRTFDDVYVALREGTIDAELVLDLEAVIHRWLAEKHLGVVEEWPTGLAPAEVDARCIDELHASLVAFVWANWSHPLVGLAVWTIGKLVRADDEALFAAALEQGLRTPEEQEMSRAAVTRGIDPADMAMALEAASDVLGDQAPSQD